MKHLKSILIALFMLNFICPYLLADTSQTSQDKNSAQPPVQDPRIHVGSDPYSSSWDPITDMSHFQQSVDQILSKTFEQMQQLQSKIGFMEPKIDVLDKPEAYLLMADLPGMKKEEIDIKIAGRAITISGERKAGEVIEKEGYYRAERSLGMFQRTVELPADILADKVTAKYENGVLEVTIPKKPQTTASATPVPIKVQ